MYSALSTLNTTTEVPLRKAPNPQLLPGRCSINGPQVSCVFTAVCVHFGWVKCRAQLLSMGHTHHTWPYVTKKTKFMHDNIYWEHNGDASGKFKVKLRS